MRFDLQNDLLYDWMLRAWFQIINKYKEPEKELTDDERVTKQQSFTEKHEKEIKKFGMMQVSLSRTHTP